MTKRWVSALATAICVLSVMVAGTVDAQSIIGDAFVWNYNDSGLALDPSWKTVAFDDSTWSTGAQPLGVGTWGVDSPTTVYANGGATTVYFRAEFNLASVAAMKAIKLDIGIDDGALVWVNGELAMNVLMTNDIGTITHETLPIGYMDPEGKTNTLVLSPTLFNEGANVVAVELHNFQPSSDAYLNALLTQIDPTYTAETNIVLGSNWKVNDFSNPGSTWTNAAFDDSTWRVLPGDVGFVGGMPTLGQVDYGLGDVSLTSFVYPGPIGGDRRATYFLRKTFNVSANLADITDVTMNGYIDDGAVVYLNGTIITNIRTAIGIDYTNYCFNGPGYDNGLVADVVAVPKALLVSGVNTLAVELKQGTPGSSDLRFDASLNYAVVPGGLLSLDVTTADQSVPNSTTTINVSGTSDNVVGDIVWTNSLGGNGTISALASWTITGVALADGANVITVTGTNAAGTAASDSVTVTRLAPTLDVTTEDQMVSYATTTMDVDGTSDSLVGLISWSNDLGGNGTIAAAANWTITGIALAEGDNVITVSGTNAAGTQASDMVIITRQGLTYSLVVTTADAVVANNVTSTDVAGTTENLVGLLSWANDAGGNGTIAVATSWTITGIGLAEGANVITVSGTNAAGASYSDNVTITRAVENWTAYNDCAWHQDPFAFDPPAGPGVDVDAVGFSTNSPWGAKKSGNMKSASGVYTPAVITFSGLEGGMLPRIFELEAGSDAETYFAGKIGTNNTALWGQGVVNMALSGLNPAKEYSVVIWSTRGARTTAYSNRYTEIEIGGVTSFANGSSASTELYGTGNSGTRVRAGDVGAVARYTAVNPGLDGQIDFTLTSGCDLLYPSSPTYTQGYINAVMVMETTPTGGNDADADGMDDTWEMTYFESTSAVNGGPTEDFDSDGFDNLSEYLAGTNPTDPTSKLEVTAVQKPTSASELVLTWKGVSGKTYTLQGVQNVSETWSTGTQVTGISGVSPLNVYTVNVVNPKGAWRVKVQ